MRRLWTLLAFLSVFLLPLAAFAETTCETTGSSDTGVFARALARGPIFALGAAFVGGLLVSLTPCVYPMIAITVSVFGANKAKSRMQAAALSGVFVLGIAVLFTVLGVVSALSGGVFGSLLGNKWVVFFLAAIFIAMAASMFGAFELALPSGLNNRLANVGGIGYGGAFSLGLVSALVAAPCTGPALTGILFWIATTKSIALGTGVMFTFALGLGVPFFLVGTFAIALPKGGSWMLGVKWVFGVALAVVSLYFLRNAVPFLAHFAWNATWFVALAIGLTVIGLVLAGIHVASERKKSTIEHLSKPMKLASILPAIVGIFMLISYSLMPKGELRWLDSEADARKLAVNEHRPIIIDFGATWCVACNELTAKTFSDQEVRSEAGRFVAIRVDATDVEDPKVEAIKDKYKVVGLPTVVVFDSEGQEKVRFNEFVPADRFYCAIKSVN